MRERLTFLEQLVVTKIHAVYIFSWWRGYLPRQIVKLIDKLEIPIEDLNELAGLLQISPCRWHQGPTASMLVWHQKRWIVSQWIAALRPTHPPSSAPHSWRDSTDEWKYLQEPLKWLHVLLVTHLWRTFKAITIKRVTGLVQTWVYRTGASCRTQWFYDQFRRHKRHKGVVAEWDKKYKQNRESAIQW